MSHHPDGPSAHPMIINCACYQGKEEAGEAAERGTLQHAYLEEFLTQPTRGKCLQLTEDERAAVEWAAKEITAKLPVGAKLEAEIRLNFFDDPDDLDPLFYGTADVIAVSPKPVVGVKTGHLFDYKSGEPHDYEWQMAAYAAMLMQRDDLGEVVVHLLYGKFKRHDEYRIERHQAERMVRHVIAKRSDPNKQPTPCDYCKWCSLAATCPALNKMAVAVAVAVGREDWKLETYHASEITKAEEMGKALKMARCLKEWSEAIEHHAREMAIKRGEIIPGYTVTKRAGAREITDARLAASASGLDPDEFLTFCNVRIGDLEKRLKKEGMEKLSTYIKRKPDQFLLVAEKEPTL